MHVGSAGAVGTFDCHCFGPQARSNLMEVGRDCVAEFILSATLPRKGFFRNHSQGEPKALCARQRLGSKGLPFLDESSKLLRSKSPYIPLSKREIYPTTSLKRRMASMCWSTDCRPPRRASTVTPTAPKDSQAFSSSSHSSGCLPAIRMRPSIPT